MNVYDEMNDKASLTNCHHFEDDIKVELSNNI